MSTGRNGAALTFDDYVTSVGDRLTQRGFSHRPDGPENYRTTVFHRRKFSITKFGFVDYFVVLAEFETIDPDAAAAFSQAAFQYGLDNKSALPRGLGGTAVVYPVVVGHSLPQSVLEWVRSYREKHWAAFEFPVATDLDRGETVYNKSKPMWGRAYYSGFKRMVDRNLTPQPPNRPPDSRATGQQAGGAGAGGQAGGAGARQHAGGAGGPPQGSGTTQQGGGSQAPQQSGEPQCPSCGGRVEADWSFCEHCGAEL